MEIPIIFPLTAVSGSAIKSSKSIFGWEESDLTSYCQKVNGVARHVDTNPFVPSAVMRDLGTRGGFFLNKMVKTDTLTYSWCTIREKRIFLIHYCGQQLSLECNCSGGR